MANNKILEAVLPNETFCNGGDVLYLWYTVWYPLATVDTEHF